MSDADYLAVFKRATGLPSPYAYQCRLACGSEANPNDGTGCQSQLIQIPTGCGKTAAVILAWLWNRVLQPDTDAREKWPRRLVFCLPMRTLVEQTRDNVQKWLGNLDGLEWKPGTSHDGKVGLHILMGGEEKADWDLYPEHDAILIGTQDMLLSRALNRGYGMSRYRWPMHFGLLNSDCLWVFDEVQLMGSGLPTTAQMEAFRAKMPGGAACHSWWMSATSERNWLETVDFKPDKLPVIDLSEVERERLGKLLDAPKPLGKVVAAAGDFKALAKEIFTASEECEGLTLAVVNTIKTARKLFEALEKLTAKSTLKPLLLHSRFRPENRANVLAQVLASEGKRQIVISTQVIEAGVDLSADILFTELAPWSSLVQRFGRCNRRGTTPNARVVWFEPFSTAPYSDDQLKAARALVEKLTNVSPNAVGDKKIPEADRPSASHVIRRKDLIELFDTTPDLAGNDLDIDRWVREVAETTVQVFWRDWEGGGKGRHPGEDQRPARREELCPASIGEFKDFLKKTKMQAWRWDFLEGEWSRVKPDETYPGQNYLIHADAGGYLDRTGWTPDSKEPVSVITAQVGKPADEQTDADPLSQTGNWQSIAQHTDWVCEELDSILFKVRTEQAALIRLAARWHDWGKAHAAFQAKVKPEAIPERDRELGIEPMAKAPKDKWLSPKLPKKWNGLDARRKFFRHELASALGVLNPTTPLSVEATERDLVAYLIAAHHGKVRLSIRSLPDEWPAPNNDRFARGVWENDRLPTVSLGGKAGDETLTPSVWLSLEPMELGLGEKEPFTNLPSWSERMLALRDDLGPFLLAYLETLLRAADERASALASMPSLRDTAAHESPRANPAMARPPAGGAASPADRAGAGERLLEHVDGAGAGKPRVAEGNTRPTGATRTIETTRGELAYSEIAARLASRAAEIQPAIAAGDYAGLPLDESLLALLHRELCADLVPEWAGKWRTIDVTVGGHEPPAFHQVAAALRDYAGDLAARWDFLSGDDEELLLETLAFAEGRYLSVHPFKDFNGRVARLWLREILRRAGLPELRLEVRTEEEKTTYFAALRAADQHDLAPLKTIWRQRFAEAV